MKKFIIIIVFVFLIAILISFNYLLWDREKQLASFQDMSDSKNLTIETLSDKMNNLDKLNRELNKRVGTLTDDNVTMAQDISILRTENIDLKRKLQKNNDMIIAFKKIIGIVPMDTVIKKWVENLNSKNYKDAQALVSKKSVDTTINDPIKFKEVYQSELKTIGIKSTKLLTELTDDEHLGKIQIKVVFDVNKPDSIDGSKEKTSQQLFQKGDNIKYITMDFDEDTNEWLILEITDEP